MGRPKKDLSSGYQACTMCKKDLPLDAFGRKAESSLMSPGASRWECRCKRCMVQKENRRRSSDPKVFLKHLARTHKQRMCRTSKRREEMLADSCVCTEVLVDLWNKQDGKCALTATPMTHVAGHGRVQTNASIDRIDPTAGYTRDNIQLVCLAVNTMKSNMFECELLNWAERLLAHRSK